jgi:hypothetical protein
MTFSNFAIALSASLLVRAKYLSKISWARRKLCPVIAAISGTVQPASASRQALTANATLTATVARAYERCLSFSMRHRCLCGAISGTASDGGAITLSNIYPDGDAYLLYVRGHSARSWSAAKHKLSFFELRIDGEDEGAFHLDRVPSPAGGQSNPPGPWHSEASKDILGSPTRFRPPFHPRYFDRFSAAPILRDF